MKNRDNLSKFISVTGYIDQLQRQIALLEEKYSRASSKLFVVIKQPVFNTNSCSVEALQEMVDLSLQSLNQLEVKLDKIKDILSRSVLTLSFSYTEEQECYVINVEHKAQLVKVQAELCI